MGDIVMALSLTVNGQTRTVAAEEDTPLLWVLREEMGLTGTKYGCGIAQCGACTVHVDGAALLSCSVTAASLAGADIVTIEGVREESTRPDGPRGRTAQAVMEAWERLDVVQCGYCQPGQIMAAVALLAETPKPGDDDINRAMRTNICRCATYLRIRAAIHEAARALEG